MAVAITVVVLMFLNACVGAFLWPYSLNSWLIFSGREASVIWWHGVVLGFLPWFGNVTIPFAVVTWILMLFIG